MNTTDYIQKRRAAPDFFELPTTCQRKTCPKRPDHVVLEVDWDARETGILAVCAEHANEILVMLHTEFPSRDLRKEHEDP